MRSRVRHPLFVVALLALACTHPAARSGASVGTPERIVTTFRGQVELPEGDASRSVIVSTATEEVVVAPATPAARELRRLAGRTVTLHGWITDAPQQELVMVVTSYDVEGERHSFLQAAGAGRRAR